LVKVKMWKRKDRHSEREVPEKTYNFEKEQGGEGLSHLQEIKHIMNELNLLIGLYEVKKLVGEIYAFVEIQKKRISKKLAAEPMVLHMIFKGNPGTGKTTVARILGRLFKELGVIQKGHLVEVERCNLVGEYIGQTAQKTREQIKKALGGILFIDEAYSLARGGEKDFGKEAIDTLVKGMEDFREEFILILAGYSKEMDWFIRSNPGLRSRFPIKINFPNYNVEELLSIADLMLKKRQYALSMEARKKLKQLLEAESEDQKNSCNARLVRNIIERAIRRQAVRLINKGKFSRRDLITILPDDLAG